jgi:hypothetical protein
LTFGAGTVSAERRGEEGSAMEPGEESSAGKRLSRKQFVVGGAAAGAAIGMGGAAANAALAAKPGSGTGTVAARVVDEELVLYNGTVHTMDDANRVVSGEPRGT